MQKTSFLVYIHAVDEGKKEVQNVLNENINTRFQKSGDSNAISLDSKRANL